MLLVRPCYLKTRIPYFEALAAVHRPRYSIVTKAFARHYQHQSLNLAQMKSNPSSIVAWYLNQDPKNWFIPPNGFDDEIRIKFSSVIIEARSGGLDEWAGSPEGSLALIILLDQFPRNIYRQSPESFSSDDQAVQVATKAIARKFDTYADQLRQILFYMPLMHSEDLLAQIACRALLNQLVSGCQEDFEHIEFLRMAARASDRHLACIQELGRFPKRNDALGRCTTDKEREWLDKYPGGF